MKKLILYFLTLIVAPSLFAQTISFSPKVSKGQGPSTFYQLDAKSNFTNNTSDSVFEWEVIEISSTRTEWEFGMCDPANCLVNIKVGSKAEFILAPGKTGEFKGDFVLNDKSGSGAGKVVCYLKSNPSIRDTVEFILNAWITSVKETAVNRELSLFPNPAKDRLVIKYQGVSREPVSMEIYNVLGSKVKSINHTGIETDVNISDLQKGIYFIRFKEGSKTISKSFSKSE
jgi:hypothetical protein